MQSSFIKLIGEEERKVRTFMYTHIFTPPTTCKYRQLYIETRQKRELPERNGGWAVLVADGDEELKEGFGAFYHTDVG